MSNRRAQVLSALKTAPATSRDISDAVGISCANASAVLSQLYHSGQLERTQLPVTGRGRPEVLYRIKPGPAANGQG